MNYQQLNEYIENYLDNDKTQSAIMLNGVWGSGKSYYIKNSLKPYLERAKKDCVIVSLYGVKDLSELSRNIFFEIYFARYKNKMFNKLPFVGVSIVGKSILKNIATNKNVDISISEKNMQRLFSSVKLKGKLIVFEDIERSNINIVEFLGYVNNFVEQDSVKVLLVANEEEILKIGMPIDLRNSFKKSADSFNEKYRRNDGQNLDKEKDKQPKVSEISKKYTLVKEKTVSDTILYTGNYKEAVKEIIISFKNHHINKYLTEETIETIAKIIKDNNGNLRSFIFSCQKTADIFDKMNASYSDEFFKCIFFSIIYYVFKFRNREQLEWSGNETLSVSHASIEYPLFKFTYEYITKQQAFDEKDITVAYNSFNEFNLYNMNTGTNRDSDLSIIFSYFVQKEIDVRIAINNIDEKLKNENVHLYSYGYLANCLVAISQYIDFDLSNCKHYLVNNLKKHRNKIATQYLFRSGIDIDDEDKKSEFTELKKQMTSALQDEIDLFELEETEESINLLCKKIIKEKGHLIGTGKLLQLLDVTLFLKALENCSASTLDSVRAMFSEMYSSSNIKDYLSSDAEAMNSIITGLNEIINNVDNLKYDCFQLLQIEWILEDLKRYHKNLKEPAQ